MINNMTYRVIHNIILVCLKYSTSSFLFLYDQHDNIIICLRIVYAVLHSYNIMLLLVFS